MKLKSFLAIALMMASAAASAADEAEVVREVTLTEAGTLAEKLGDDLTTVDRLTVSGPINKADFTTMWRASFEGHLAVLDLKNAVTPDGRIPDRAFWDINKQIVPGNDGLMYTIPVALREVTLPDNVTETGSHAFAYAYNLETVHLPEGLRTIGDATFYDCRKLSCGGMWTLPASLEKIGESAFASCKGLEGAIVLPEGLKEIGQMAFYLAWPTAVNLPESLEVIGSYAFVYTKLTEVTVPGSCRLEGEAHFESCFWLKKLTVADGVTSIPNEFVSGCLELEEVNLPGSVETIGKRAFENCTGLKRLELPAGITEIDEEAFEYCSGLTEMVFPSTLRRLGKKSCWGWSSISKVMCPAMIPPVCEGENPAVNGGSAESTTPFGPYNTPIMATLCVPEGTVEAYKGTWGWHNFASVIAASDFPAAGIDAIVADPAAADAPVYDLQGRRVSSLVPGQVYIKGGCKYIAR